MDAILNSGLEKDFWESFDVERPTVQNVISAFESKCSKLFMNRLLDSTEATRQAHQIAINLSPSSLLLMADRVSVDNLAQYASEIEKIQQIQRDYNPLKIPLYSSRIERYISQGLEADLFEQAGAVDALVGAKILDKISLVYQTKLSLNPNFDGDFPIQKVDGKWVIWSQNSWVDWLELSKRMTFNEQLRELVSLEDEDQVWEFVYPEGFVPVGKDSIIPVMKLSAEEFSPILEHAKKSQLAEGQEEKTLDCVVQFHTTIRRSFIPKWRIFDNFVTQMPNHMGSRLFIKNGDEWDLYCPGFEQDRICQSDIMSRLPLSFFETSKIRYSKYDFEEYRMYSSRMIGSLPISQNTAKAILNLFNKSNGCSFNFVRQNCSKLAERIANTFEKVSFKVNLLDLCFHSLPSLEDLPLLSWTMPIKEFIYKVVGATAELFNPVIPEIAKTIFTKVLNIFVFIPWKILTFGINFAFYVFGGRTTVVGDEFQDPVDDDSLNRFKVAITDFFALFDDQTMTICHPKKVLKWLESKGALYTHEKPKTEPLYMNFYPEQKV